jgi:prophage tail gpP-like protein
MILKINDRLRNRVVEFFTDINISLKYDNIAGTFSLKYLFDPNNKEHKELSCIGHYHLCTLEHNGELILTGQILSIEMDDSSEKELVHITGYSLPGVLDDCEVPTSVYPLQSDGLSLRQIAQKFIAPFGIKMVVDSSVSKLMDEIYDETEAKPTQSVRSYLTELAAQKDINLTHDARGRLVFTKASPNQVPLIELKRGTFGCTRVKFSFNGQQIHSQITVMAQADVEEEAQAGENTVYNPWCPIVFRPKVATQSSGNGDDTLQAAKNMLTRELKNISWTAEFNSWVVNKKIIRPGMILSIQDSEIYLYKKAQIFIEDVNYRLNDSQEIAIIKCVPKEVYTSSPPNYLFKGYNLH